MQPGDLGQSFTDVQALRPKRTRWIGNVLHVSGFAIIGPFLLLLLIGLILLFIECGVSGQTGSCLLSRLDPSRVLPFLALNFVLTLVPGWFAGMSYVFLMHRISPDVCMPMRYRFVLGISLNAVFCSLWISAISAYPYLVGMAVLNQHVMMLLATTALIAAAGGAFAGAFSAALMGEWFYNSCFYRKIKV